MYSASGSVAQREAGLDRRAKAKLFEQIRREYKHGTIRGIAKKLGIHRRMVREAVLSAVRVERKIPIRERPKLEPAMAFIAALLEADLKAPRKQRLGSDGASWNEGYAVFRRRSLSCRGERRESTPVPKVCRRFSLKLIAFEEIYASRRWT